MYLKGVLFAAMYFFAHDCDNTVVYYESEESTLIPLPASSTGKVGYVAPLTLSALSDIASDGTPIICVSGARASTMTARQPLFPMIMFWICENGGRVFKTSDDKSSMVELEEYTQYVNDMVTSSQWHALDAFATELENDDRYRVDRKGYRTSFRVSRSDNEVEKADAYDGDGSDAAAAAALTRLCERVPKELVYTFNLGYLDIQVPGLGKRNSINWIVRECGGVDGDYVFFGDDDNDIDAAAGALEAYIANPRSRRMQFFLDGIVSRSGGVCAESVMTSGPRRVVTNEGLTRHQGAAALLREARASLQALNAVEDEGRGPQ